MQLEFTLTLSMNMPSHGRATYNSFPTGLWQLGARVTITLLCCFSMVSHANSADSSFKKTQASSFRSDVENPPLPSGPTHEFHPARLAFDTTINHGWGPGRPWWRIDWPEAEMHFLQGLNRYTAIHSAADSVHVDLTDDALFDYPWLFAQQVGRWKLDDASAHRLGEYLLRGGFMLADDIHGPDDWNQFAEAMLRALPNTRFERIPTGDSIISILYELDERVQIPGRRHIVSNDGQGNVDVRMPYRPHEWRGIKDPNGRWIVAINYNMDMGDSWEHADDAYYPVNMTTLGYQLGINYIIYSLTH